MSGAVLTQTRLRPCGDFLSNRAWYRYAVGDTNLIVCRRSALEFLELFVGYTNEAEIEVYALYAGECENVVYHVVPSFDDIDIIRIGDVYCTSVDQTINDLLSDYDNVDEQSLVEALSSYYYSHENSFRGLSIRKENQQIFEKLSRWAIEYYEGG